MFRDVVGSIAKNTSIMSVQQLITWASTFLLMFFLPRCLGPVEYGRFFLASSIVGIPVLLVQYGGAYLVAKNVSRSRGETGQILVDAIGFRMVFGAVSIICVVAFTFLVDYPPSVRTIIIILSVSLMWEGTQSVLQASFQGHELLKYNSIGIIMERLFLSLVGVSVLLLGGKAVVYACVALVAGLSNTMVLSSFVKRVAPSLPKFNAGNARKQIKDGFPYFLFAAFSAIYYRIDSILLSKMAPENVVGWYGGAYRLFDALNFFPFIFTTAVFPILSRLWQKEEAVHRRTTQKSLEIMIIVGILVGVMVTCFSDKIIGLFYGLSYSPSIVVLQVLSTGLVLLYVDMVLGTTLISSEKQTQMSIVSLAMIPINVGLNVILIPYFQSRSGNGGMGAAWATVMTEFCVLIAFIGLMPRGVLKGFRMSVFLKSLLAAALMVGAVLVTRSWDSLWPLAIVVGPIVYALVLFVLRTFEPVEEDFLRSIMAVRSVRALRNLFDGDKSDPQ